MKKTFLIISAFLLFPRVIFGQVDQETLPPQPWEANLGSHIRATASETPLVLPADIQSCSTYTQQDSIDTVLKINEEAVPGYDLHIKASVTNHNVYPVVHGNLFLKVIKITGTTTTNSTVDQFIAVNDITLNQSDTKDFNFIWHVPNNLTNGTYIMVPYYIDNYHFETIFKTSNLGDTGAINFTVEQGVKDGVTIDPLTVQINGEAYSPLGSATTLDTNEDAEVSLIVKNTSAQSKNIKITWNTYNTVPVTENLLATESATATIAGKGSLKIAYKVSDKTHADYIVTTEVAEGELKAVAEIHFVRSGITDVSFKKLSMMLGQNNTIFSCIQTTGGVVSNAHVVLNLTNENGQVMGTKDYVGVLPPGVSALASNIDPTVSFNKAILTGMVYVNDRVMDKESIPFDCISFGSEHCAGTQTTERHLFEPFVLIGVLVIVVLLVLLIIFIKRRKSVPPVFLLLMAFVGISMLFPSRAHAGSTYTARPIFEGNYGKTVNQTFFIPTLHTPWGRVSGVMYAGFYSVDTINGISAFVASKGYVRKNGVYTDDSISPTLAIGDQLLITPGYTQPELIQWSGLPHTPNPNYRPNLYADSAFATLGRWLTDTQLTSWIASDYTDDASLKINTYTEKGLDFDDAHSELVYYALLRLAPRVQTIDLTGSTAGLSCADQTLGSAFFGPYPAKLCTVTSAGIVKVAVKFGATTGDVTGAITSRSFTSGVYTSPITPYSWNSPADAMSNTITSTSYKDVEGIMGPPYKINVPATSVNFTFTVIDTNNPPLPPTITGPVQGGINQNYAFFFQATDPDGNNIVYDVDWDMNGTVDLKTPSSGYIYSGAIRSAGHTWTTLGSKTFQARTRDTGGKTSAWTTHTINIINYPPIDPFVFINGSGSPFTGYINYPYTVAVYSYDPDSNIIFYQYDNDNNGVGDSAQPYSGRLRSGTSQYKTLTFATRGTRTYQVRAADVAGTNNSSSLSGPANPVNTAVNAQSTLSGWTPYTLIIANQQPSNPGIGFNAANTFVTSSRQYFTFRSVDPDASDGDKVKYTVDWGDGSAKTITGPNISGDTITLDHIYTSAGDYTINAFATDTYTSPLSSLTSSFPIHIISSGSATCTGTTCGVCTVNGSTSDIAVEAYGDVVWSAEMGGKGSTSSHSYTWSGTGSLDQVARSFSATTHSITRYYTTQSSIPRSKPKVTMRDTGARTVSLNCPGVSTVTARPILLEVGAGKNTSSITGETNLYAGSKGAVGVKLGNGMPPLSCSALLAFIDHETPSFTKKLVTDPAKASSDDPFRIPTLITDVTSVFTKLGDYFYTVECSDPTNGSLKKTSIIHVVPSPDFQEF